MFVPSQPQRAARAPRTPLAALLLGALSLACAGPAHSLSSAALEGDAPAAGTEQVPDFAALELAYRSAVRPRAVQLERVTTAVPWPRGLAFVDDSLVVLARGRHRRAGGIDASIPDRSGSLLLVDVAISEPVVLGTEAGAAVRANATLFAAPDPETFALFDPDGPAPLDQFELDRPYCTLIFDAVSRNLILCGYAGIDKGDGTFRKNASDSVLRYDLRDGAWHVVEKHDPGVVPIEQLGPVVPNTSYPQFDVGELSERPTPHGWLNGPNGLCTVGDYLYAAGKDNSRVVAYELGQIRADSAAPAPHGRPVLERRVELLVDGQRVAHDLFGPSALAQRDGYLYVGYRTSSVIVRLPLDEHGLVVPGAAAELIGVFQPFGPDQKSANLIDMIFAPDGRLLVACALGGRVWDLGLLDPAQGANPVFTTIAPERVVDWVAPEPLVDLVELTGKPKAGVGNIACDREGRLYICSGNYDAGVRMAGVIYRAVPRDATTGGQLGTPPPGGQGPR